MPISPSLPLARRVTLNTGRLLSGLACLLVGIGSPVVQAAQDAPTSAIEAASRPRLEEAWPARPASQSASGAARAAASAPEMLDLRERLDRKLAEIRAAHARRPAAKVRPSPAHQAAASGAAAADGSTNSPQAIALVRAYRAGRLGPHVAPAASGAAAASGATTGGAATTHWSYAGAEGPSSWGGLRRDYATCASGQRQSPIDIRDGIRVDLEPIRFDYHPSGFRVIDNGHTIQVNLDPGNFISVMGRRFELVQFHFHRPSEERVNGRQFAMEVHLVHKDRDGKLAVVAVLIDAGSANPVVQQVWNDLPLEKHEEQRGRALMDVAALLPGDRSYYTYMGSLTTPPCSEGVLWMVLKQPAALSPDQIGIFARLYPMNARPVQSSSGRLIKESN